MPNKQDATKRKGIAIRYKDRFIGREKEILCSVRLRGSIATMTRYGASDYICWTKYIKSIRGQFDPADFSPSDTQDNELSEHDTGFNSELPVVAKIPIISISRERAYDNGYSNRRQLADELVNAFTGKVVALKSDNDRLYARIQELEEKLMILEDREDDDLSRGIIQSIEVIKRC